MGRRTARKSRAYDFRAFRKIVDVGGGHGRLLAMMLAKAAAARGVLYDLPAVVDGAGPELGERRRRHPVRTC